MARYRPNDPNDYLAIIDFINRAKTEGFDVDLKKYYRDRSNPQNRFLHMALGMFANKYGCSLAIAKEVFLKQYACPHIFRVDLKDNDGNDITYYRSTAIKSINIQVSFKRDGSFLTIIKSELFCPKTFSK